MDSLQLIVGLVFGAVLGSFGAVVGYRLLGDETILGRSRCDHCSHRLHLFDLIPVFSFIFRAGKCRYCRKNIPVEYFVAEIVGAGIFVCLFTHQISLNISFLISLLAISTITVSLVGIFVADWQQHLIPDELLISLLLAILFLVFPLKKEIFVSKLLISIIISGIFFCLWWFSDGKGMGFGDVKLIGLLAFWLGKEKIWIGLYLAFSLAAIWGLLFIFKDKATMKSKIAFGPFLIIGSLLSLKYGEFFWYVLRNYFSF